MAQLGGTSLEPGPIYSNFPFVAQKNLVFKGCSSCCCCIYHGMFYHEADLASLWSYTVCSELLGSPWDGPH